MQKLAGLVLGAVLLLHVPPAQAGKKERAACVKDVEFALETLEKECGHFFKLKGINWKQVARQFRKEAKKVGTLDEHYLLMVRLVARLKDGHAHLEKLPAAQSAQLPADLRAKTGGPGMFWCRVGKRIYVKTTWNAARSAGLEPGYEIIEVDEMPVLTWLDARIAELRETHGFSTDHGAFAAACHWGLRNADGARMKVRCRAPGERRISNKTISYRGAKLGAHGPVFPSKGLKGDGDVAYGTTEAGWGYVHIRRCKGNLPQRMDEALGALRNPPGLILDFRANSGGGFDHDAFMGRFVPKGKRLSFAKTYASSGAQPYGGPIVVIVDGMTISAGETASGIFKEDGRGYLIGECPTAGMSSSKNRVECPSGLFALFFSVHSNKLRFNHGKGIEGIGVPPHEIVEYDPEDLAAGRDTMILRAETLLADFPRKKVPYDPQDFGWTPGEEE